MKGKEDAEHSNIFFCLEEHGILEQGHMNTCLEEHGILEQGRMNTTDRRDNKMNI
jgi:hypothetical protein